MKQIPAIAVVVTLAAGGAIAREPKPEETWPGFRGHEMSGVALSSKVPVRWSANENVKWSVPIAGQGWSSPIVWGDTVFVTSAISGRPFKKPTPGLYGNEYIAEMQAQGLSNDEISKRAQARDNEVPAESDAIRYMVYALDGKTGKIKWEREAIKTTPFGGRHRKNTYASETPVTDGERVYAWFGTGQLVALDAAGKQVWTKNLAKEYGAFDIQWGHASSPVLFQDSIILLCYHAPASYILALDKRTGAVKWKVDKAPGQESYSSPIVVQGPGGNELIVNSNSGVESFDPATGKSLWTYPELNRFPIPVAMVDNGVLYLSRGYRSSPFMAIRLGGRGDITNTHVAWRVPTGGPYVSSLVHYQGVIYMSTDNGILSAVDAANGQRLWQERVGGTFSASPIAGDGKIYFVSEGGETIVIKAGRTFELVSRNKLDGHFVASPAAAAGRVFLRADDRIFAIGK